MIFMGYDGKFLKGNQVFHHTFCIVIRTIMKLECFQQTFCLLRHLVYTFLSFSDLKSNLNYAIDMEISRKMMVFSKFLLSFFFIFCGLNSKKDIHREILHFEKHSSLCNRFEKRTMFFVFDIFIFYANLEFRPAPCQ